MHAYFGERDQRCECLILAGSCPSPSATTDREPPVVISSNWPNGELRAVPCGPLVNSGSQSNFSRSHEHAISSSTCLRNSNDAAVPAPYLTSLSRQSYAKTYAGAFWRLAVTDRGCVKTRAERTGRQTRLARSPRTGFEAVRRGKATLENRIVSSFHTASTHSGRSVKRDAKGSFRGGNSHVNFRRSAYS